ncbi:MAG: hypothetical protein QM809_14080 [Gordonia sp. (in: high G+C Gram-positive bacteria)]|uniref:LGFP repeat-containing protein n=1 Tax=Gordonia sp. (in: high G+C Gram-positive bacteria) TaxID=84139 RepID=UPI0039E23443
MRKPAHRRTAALAGLAAAVALLAAGCGDDDSSAPEKAAESTTSAAQESAAGTGASTAASSAAAATEVKLDGERDVEVTLTGPIAARYSTATDEQKKILGKPLTGSHNAEIRESGVVFQQFKGGVIVAKSADAGTPAYIVYGKVRDAWNVERDKTGVPNETGENGSAGPLGVPTSDVTVTGDVEKATFENGEITHDTKTGKVVVTVDGKKVDAGLK